MYCVRKKVFLRVVDEFGKKIKNNTWVNVNALETTQKYY